MIGRLINMNPSIPIAFIGGGNMALSIIGGLVNSHWPADKLSVSDPLAERRQELTQRFALNAFQDNAECAGRGEVVVLAVKPQFMKSAVKSISAVLQRQKPLVISIAAGIRGKDILDWAGGTLALVRAMPNTPALVNAGIAGLFANESVTAEQRTIAQTILQAVGETVWVEQESLLNAVTAVSGSGPAYFFKLMELLADGAVHHGLDRKTADSLAIQTALGAAMLAKHSEQTPAVLRRRVTSPGGATQAALEKMQALGMDDSVAQGITAALERSEQLGSQFSGNSGTS